MASSEQTATNTKNTTVAITNDQSLKLAVAISLLRSKLLQKQKPPLSGDPPPESDVTRWKRKAKERKQQLFRLREDLKEAEDASRCDLSSQGASCKCFFYDNLGKLNSDGSDQRFNDVLRRRFLRQATLRNLLSTGKNMDFIEGIVSSLIMRLIRRMCSPSQQDGPSIDTDAQFYIQHLIRKLGSEAYIGQRSLFSVSQRISVVAETLLFMDPFDDSFPYIHRCLYIMIQLIEFLVSDYLMTWLKDEGFDNVLFEEWVISLLHARKGLGLLENRNGLYVLYMDRVMGQLAKQVCQASSLQKLNRDILDSLFG
ncbi:conserved hypothetical protein [Ricinus communis]|uniref:Multipolar spindle 1 n=1 Tax=Ricinus communis TaxID=3988 RepID=B9T743_RICCO|nr:conserved hypothetical protein [Ricinus communis]